MGEWKEGKQWDRDSGKPEYTVWHRHDVKRHPHCA